MRSLLVLLCLISLPTLAERTLRSSPVPATLLELYTSEGCSSCPPADRWYSGLLEHPELWRRVVPVAFHVDYWNYLGWEDRFARPGFAERQRDYHSQGSTNGVYTPGVIAGGREWRAWRQRPQQIPFSEEEIGVLEFRDGGGQFAASFTPAGDRADRPVQLHVAVLGFGMQSPVAAGENRGRLLEHDFVVLGYKIASSSDLKWSGQMPAAEHADEAKRLAVVAWVSPRDRLGAVQAVGGWR